MSLVIANAVSKSRKKLAKTWVHLRIVSLDAYTADLGKPKVLIGQGNCHLIMYKIMEGQPSTPVASRTKLGWVVHGRTSAHQGRQRGQLTHCIWRKSDGLEEL